MVGSRGALSQNCDPACGQLIACSSTSRSAGAVVGAGATVADFPACGADSLAVWGDDVVASGLRCFTLASSAFNDATWSCSLMTRAWSSSRDASFSVFFVSLGVVGSLAVAARSGEDACTGGHR